MNKFFFATLLCFALFASCNKKCNCSEPWDENTIYQDGDVVSHNGSCWRAFAQGGGSNVEPGTSGGDIWEECDD